MIVHVWRRALQADLGPVLVACADAVIAEIIQDYGGTAIMTDPGHPSGSDRVYEALCQFDPEGLHDPIINLQGDLPTLEPKAIHAVIHPFTAPLHKGEMIDITSLIVQITDPIQYQNPNIVKVAVAFDPDCLGQSDYFGKMGQAIYFSRLPIPAGEGPYFHHIGLYAWRREALARFVTLPQGWLEQRERLEQLRALENGMRLEVVCIDTIPLGVDTPADLIEAERLLTQINLSKIT